MSIRTIASSATLGLFVLAVPLLTGANSNGCGGGDVVVGGDGGSTTGTTSSTGSGNTNNTCNADSDCVIEDASCLVCADGSCGPTKCVQGTCQKTCPDQPNACQSDADCPVQPEICQECVDGTCAPWGCQAGACGFACAPPADPACDKNSEFLEITGDGATQTFTFSDCPSNAPASGVVEAYLVSHVNMPTGLAIRSCSGQTAWLTLYGASGDVLPGMLANATTDYVNASGAEHGAKHTDVNITYFGQVGQVVEGNFTSQLDVGPDSPITLFGKFRACRAPNHQDP